jgi:hypothetical protein
MSYKQQVKNRIQDIDEYLKSAPLIKGLSEIHIFFEPLNPKPKTVAKFVEICDIISTKRKDEKHFTKIKPCHLSLHFKGVGDIRVMQSSRYITSDSMNDIIKECYSEADTMQTMFNEAFLANEIDEKVSVIREKIEAIASANGVPRTTEDAKKFDRYFEHHIKLKRKEAKDDSPITDTELNDLKQLSITFTDLFRRPVPLSFINNMYHQRYLNVRFYDSGSQEARKKVNEIENAINSTNNFVWDKTISEYVWFDSFKALDKGWIDFE